MCAVLLSWTYIDYTHRCSTEHQPSLSLGVDGGTHHAQHSHHKLQRIVAGFRGTRHLLVCPRAAESATDEKAPQMEQMWVVPFRNSEPPGNRSQSTTPTTHSPACLRMNRLLQAAGLLVSTAYFMAVVGGTTRCVGGCIFKYVP